MSEENRINLDSEVLNELGGGTHQSQDLTPDQKYRLFKDWFDGQGKGFIEDMINDGGNKDETMRQLRLMHSLMGGRNFDAWVGELVSYVKRDSEPKKAEDIPQNPMVPDGSAPGSVEQQGREVDAYTSSLDPDILPIPGDVDRAVGGGNSNNGGVSRSSVGEGSGSSAGEHEVQVQPGTGVPDADLELAISNIIWPTGSTGPQASKPVVMDDLPDGAKPTDYFTNQEAKTYWEKWKKEGKLRRLRMMLFRSGYYNTGSGETGFSVDADIDFGDDVTGADIDALYRAMGDANVSDPTKGLRGEVNGLENFLIDKKNDMHTDLTMKARLRSQMLAMAERYGLPPSSAEQSMDDLFSGNVTTKDLELRMRNRAKALYPGWSTQLDGGMSMAEIASPYRSAAAEVLGIPNMSFSDPLMRGALNRQGKDGTPGYMTLDQFNRALRSDSRWEYTDNAHAYYGDLQNTIMNTFGM